jgi:hypothetical protein
MTQRSPENTLFELAVYLVACARLAVDENLGLASFRLIEGASRLIASAEELGVPKDAFLRAELPLIDQEKMRVMHDLDGYISALDAIQARFVEEAKRRNLTDEPV